MRKARASLITSIMIGLFAVTTAGVSTYAWFQANASATITATGDTTTITVSAPDEVGIDDPVLYYYTGNGANGYPGTPSITWGNFAEADTDAKKTVTNLWPGRKMTFCVYSRIISGDAPSLTLSLTDFTVGTDSNLNIRSDSADYSSGAKIEMATAINIYTSTYTRTAGNTMASATAMPAVGSDVFIYNEESESYAKPSSFKLATVSNPEVVYFFYTVEFSNVDSTYYSEYTTANGSTEKIWTTTPAGTRYFSRSTSGDSNCYVGLNFTLDELTLTL